MREGGREGGRKGKRDKREGGSGWGKEEGQVRQYYKCTINAFICHGSYGNLVRLSHSSSADSFSRRLYHCRTGHCVSSVGEGGSEGEREERGECVNERVRGREGRGGGREDGRGRERGRGMKGGREGGRRG